MPPMRCPRCGATQQWTLWRRCFCGHDFGPPESQPAPELAPHVKTAATFRRVMTARLVASALLQVPAIAIALADNIYPAMPLAIIGASIGPSRVDLKPPRMKLSEGLGIVAIVAVAAVLLNYIDQILRPVLRSYRGLELRIATVILVLYALYELAKLPRRYRAALASFSS